MENEGKYLNLKPHVDSWSIYTIEGPYVTDRRIGTLAPSQFGGLSYQVLEDKGGSVYTIQTESFGKVAIWAGDSDSSFTASPLYTSGATLPSGSTGKYVNLKPHVESWSIYHINGPYVPASRLGTLAPSQFGGLSYAIVESKGNHIYVIQTESFGQVAIWAGDSDSTFTSVPTYVDRVNGGGSEVDNGQGTGQYLNLHAHVSSWSIYNVAGPYIPANRIGTLSPAQFGGLSYAILGSPTTDVYIIQTESFGQVAIWAGDSDSAITGNPMYAVGSFTGGENGSPGGTYVNLSPTVSSWSIYNVNGPYVTASRIGTLAPSQFGGLSYRILQSLGNDIYVIQTESFGKVAIWAGDSDSTFTSNLVYMDGTGGFDYIQNPGYHLSEIDFTKFTAQVVPRSFWGASGIQGAGMDGQFTQPIKYLVVHHTAGADPQVGSDYEVMRGIQNYHQSLNWGDIGYHFCIGQHGTIMEGRPMPYVGAHVGKPHNFDSIGVSLFGNFMNHMPLEVQMQKLIPLLADLCVEYGISPDNILGHRDMDSNYGATSCPGDAFYFGTNQLASVRSEVKKLIGSNPGNGTPYPDREEEDEPANPIYSEPIKVLEKVDSVVKENWEYLSYRYDSSNQAIINYLRSYIYNSEEYGKEEFIPSWWLTIGPADKAHGTNVATYVRQTLGLERAIFKYIDVGKEDFIYENNSIDLPHLTATLKAHLQFTAFPDFWTGWGGDLATLMKDITGKVEKGDSRHPQTIADELMGGLSTFSRIDILADIDAVALANLLTQRENYIDGFLRVFKEYFKSVTSSQRRKTIVKNITESEAIPSEDSLTMTIQNKMEGWQGFQYFWRVGYALQIRATYEGKKPNAQVVEAACRSLARYILHKL